MDNAMLFLNKLAEDQGLQSALMAAVQTAVTKEEKVTATIKVANEAGFAVSAEELQKMVESIQSSLSKLTDDDLENVAGGFRAPQPQDWGGCGEPKVSGQEGREITQGAVETGGTVNLNSLLEKAILDKYLCW